MKCQKIEKIEYTITLSLKEAQLLKGLIQNPLTEDEEPEITTLRFDLWNALSDVPVR